MTTLRDCLLRLNDEKIKSKIAPEIKLAFINAVLTLHNKHQITLDIELTAQPIKLLTDQTIINLGYDPYIDEFISTIIKNVNENVRR